MDLTLVPFDQPTETRTFEKCRFEVYTVGPLTLGRATYEPGWKWSEHVGARAARVSARSSTWASCWAEPRRSR